jgi:hypothetical protein
LNPTFITIFDLMYSPCLQNPTNARRYTSFYVIMQKGLDRESTLRNFCLYQHNLSHNCKNICKLLHNYVKKGWIENQSYGISTYISIAQATIARTGSYFCVTKQKKVLRQKSFVGLTRRLNSGLNGIHNK